MMCKGKGGCKREHYDVDAKGGSVTWKLKGRIREGIMMLK